MHRMEAFSKNVYRERGKCLIIPFYRASSVPYALFFGDSWYFRNTFAAYLNKLYPNSYFYDKWRGVVSNYSDFVPVATLRQQYPCLLLFGSHDECWDSEMLIQVAEQDGERLYLLKFPE